MVGFEAMNKDWHSGHFCCWHCDASLTGQRYILRDEHPYCIKCYEEVSRFPAELSRAQRSQSSSGVREQLR